MKDKQPRTIVVCRAKVRPQTDTELHAALAGAMLPFLQLLAWLLAPQSAENEGAEWIRHDRSPLGARRTRELARRGAFPGARKVGRTWLIPRAEMDAYVERAGAAPSANDNAGGTSADVADLAASMGYTLTPATRGRGQS